MLVLNRKERQRLVIDGRIIVEVIQIRRDTVRLGITADSSITIHREEIYEAIQREQRLTPQDAESQGQEAPLSQGGEPKEASDGR